MEHEITTLPPTTEANSSQSPAVVSAMQQALAGFQFITFFLGVVGNGLYLWVLGMKMRRTVTTVWFLHLVSCTAFVTLLLPFFAVYIFFGFHWVFGTAMCKVLNAGISVCMFSSTFLLTLISLDRYTLTHHPVWSQNHRTVRRAGKLAVCVWLVSFALSTPQLVFQETCKMDGGRIACLNNYSLSKNCNRAEMLDVGRQIELALFVVRFLLGFLLPFCTMAGCYSRVALKMKEKRLVWTGKPLKVMVTAGVSFFLGWLPYHLYSGSKLYKDVPESVLGALLVIYVITSCFSACFTPIFYLFVGEKFWQVFKMSLLTLVKAAFVDELESSAHEPSARHGSEFQTM